jgi:hypothetical protein
MTHPLNPQMTKAAQEGNLPELQRLKDAGAEIAFAGNDNPLLQASCKGHVACMRWLIDNGADVNRADNDGKWTPLMCAAHYGFAEAARLLLENGASRELRNHLNNTALEIARAQQKPAVVNVMLNSADEISFSYPLNDRVMQEVYNFPRRERVTLIRNGEAGPVEAVQRDSFNSLDDLSGLRKAFAVHKRMGGKLEEDEVFPDLLPKAKLVIRKEM